MATAAARRRAVGAAARGSARRCPPRRWHRLAACGRRASRKSRKTAEQRPRFRCRCGGRQTRRRASPFWWVGSAIAMIAHARRPLASMPGRPPVKGQPAPGSDTVCDGDGGGSVWRQVLAEGCGREKLLPAAASGLTHVEAAGSDRGRCGAVGWLAGSRVTVVGGRTGTGLGAADRNIEGRGGRRDRRQQRQRQRSVSYHRPQPIGRPCSAAGPSSASPCHQQPSAAADGVSTMTVLVDASDFVSAAAPSTAAPRHPAAAALVASCRPQPPAAAASRRQRPRPPLAVARAAAPSLPAAPVAGCSLAAAATAGGGAHHGRVAGDCRGGAPPLTCRAALAAPRLVAPTADAAARRGGKRWTPARAHTCANAQLSAA